MGQGRRSSNSADAMSDLGKIAEAAAPDKSTDRALRKELQEATKVSLTPILSDKTLTKETRAALKGLTEGWDSASWRGKLISDSRPPLVTDPLRSAVTRLKQTREEQQQVIESHLPSYSLKPTSNGNLSLARNTPCIDRNLTFYPGLTARISDLTRTLTLLSESVGRVELKKGNSDPILIGTAFVVDRARGVVATACHVVDEIAEFTGGNWVLPASKHGSSTSVLLDFGEADSHDLQREHRITGVMFVPNIVGCDGALLQVDVSRPLPPQLPLAMKEPNLVHPQIIDAISIGYPGRDLSSATDRTRQYFSCVRAEAGLQAKFLVGGKVTKVEPMGSYSILNHIVPTTKGQSGSPIIDISDPTQVHVIGIHVCCVDLAQSRSGSPCQWRNEENPQKAISVFDLIRLGGLRDLRARR